MEFSKKNTGRKVGFRAETSVHKGGLAPEEEVPQRADENVQGSRKNKSDRDWDKAKVVDDSLLIEKSAFAPVLKLVSKILFGIILSVVVFFATSISQVGYLVLFQGLSDSCTDCQFSNKVNVSYITPDNLTATIMEKLNETAAESNAVLRERSEDEAENIMKEMMQRCVAIGQLCILLVPHIHMFLTGTYFFLFKQIHRKADTFRELSFFLMLVRTIIETGLFAVFSLLIVPRLSYITVLSLGFSQMFVPAIIRLLFDSKGKSQEKKTPTEGENRQEKKSPILNSIFNGVAKCFVFVIFIIHFALIGYNAYVQGLDELWMGLLYLYIIWSSLKYAGNYLKIDNPIFPVNKNFETHCMRSWIASIFQIITTLTAVFLTRKDNIFESRLSQIDPNYQGYYDFAELDDFETSFTQFCVLYGFCIWFAKFISVLAIRLKLQYNSFVIPVYLSFAGVFFVYHFYEIKITLFYIGNGETEFHSALNISRLDDINKMWDSSEALGSVDTTKLLVITGAAIPAAAYPLACFGTGFIVFLFVTWHVFKDQSTHYALERDLMFNPHYEIGFQGTNIMLNRRKKRTKTYKR